MPPLFHRAARKSYSTILPLLVPMGVLLIIATVSSTYGQPLTSDTISIMPLGNSITEAKNGKASYRCWLWKMLTDAGYVVDFVGSRHGVYDGQVGRQTESVCPYETFDEDHEGHYGWNIKQVLYSDVWKRYPGCLGQWLVGNAPDIVLLHLGTNDVRKEQNDPASSIALLGDMIDTLRACNPSVAILLATIISTTDGSINSRIATFNALIPGLAVEKSTVQSPVLVVDQAEGYDAMVDNADCYHPNEIGEKKIAEKWFTALCAFIKSGSTRLVRDYSGSSNRPASAISHPRARISVYSLNGRRISTCPISHDGFSSKRLLKQSAGQHCCTGVFLATVEREGRNASVMVPVVR